jgi:RHS repeat-associated protein
MSRRVCLSALFVGTFLVISPLRVTDWGMSWPTTRNSEAAAPSGAVAPAPLNASFDDDLDPGALASADARAGKIQPPGWTIAAGTARPQTDPVTGRKYAVLDRDDASLVTSPFTVTRMTPILTFEFSFPVSGAISNGLDVTVLSGSNFATRTRAKSETCSCSREWSSSSVDLTPWIGQSVELQLSRRADSPGPVAIDEVGANLRDAQLGRQRGVALAGDPVNTGTGNWIESETDVAMAFWGLSLGVTRNYNASSTYSGQFGLGWTWVWDMSVTWSQYFSGPQSVRYADGKVVQYSGGTFDGSYFWYTNGSDFNQLRCASGWLDDPYYAYVPARPCVLITPSQVSYGFDSQDRLASVSDRNGNTISYTHAYTYCTGEVDPYTFDCSGTWVQVPENVSDGTRQLVLTLSSGRITQITSPLGTTSYSYTSSKLTSVTDLRGYAHTYTYNASNLLQEWKVDGVRKVYNIYDSSKRVVEQQDALNNATCFKYGTSPSYSSANCPDVSPAPSSGQTVVVDSRGNKTLYDFNTDFRTTQVTDALGGVTTLVYGTNGVLTCSTDPLGNKVSRSYDASGNLTQYIDALNTNSSCGLKTGGVASSFTYTSKNDLDLATDALGRKLDPSYDSYGNVTGVLSKDASNNVKLKSCFTIGSLGVVTEAIRSSTLTDCTGNKTKFTYNAYGEPLTAVNPRFSGQGTPPQTSLTYDTSGRVTSSTDELGHTTSWTYNASSQVLTVANGLGNTTTNTYDARGNLLSVTDALNHTTTYTYDNANRLTSVADAIGGVTSYAYDANGNRTSVTNARGKTTSYVYDELNRLTSITDPNSRTTYFYYDAASRLIKRKDARSLVTKYFYDAGSRLIRVEHWNSSETTLADQVTYQYDAVGNRTQMVDPTGTTSYSYDALNRPTSITFPGNKTVSYSYNNVGDRSRITYPDSKYVDYTYDAADNLSTVTDWLGKQTSYTYDNAGRLVQATLPSSTGLTTLYNYDNANRLTAVRNGRIAAVPNAMLVAAFDFTSSATWTPPTGMTEAFDIASKAVPNAGGISIEGAYALQASAGASGSKTATASGDADYGVADLLALRPASGSSISFRSASSAAVDGSGSLSISKPAGTSQNDVLVASISVRPTSVPITPPSGWTLVSRYDNSGSPTGYLATYIKVAGASEPASYTWTLGCCSGTGSAGGIQAFTGVDTSNAIVKEAGQTTASGLSHAAPSIDTSQGYTPLYEFAYTVNAVGNRTQVVDSTGTTTYGYDNLYRLTSVTYPGPTTDNYTYDAVGNRATKNSTTYSYDNADQMTAAGGVNYTYDANGNQTGRGSDTFSWDYENRLTSATVSGTQTTYTYNGDGLRQMRASGGNTTPYIWDVAAKVPMMLQDGTSTFVYGLGLISTTDGSGNQTYYLHDGLGNTVALCNGSGTVTATYTYDVYGVVRSHTGGTTEFTFTGEQNDPNGLEYLRARYYDPATGRFVSHDNWIAFAADPRTLNGYAYANNNPVNLSDPSGMCIPICIIPVAVGGVIITAWTVHNVQVYLNNHPEMLGHSSSSGSSGSSTAQVLQANSGPSGNIPYGVIQPDESQPPIIFTPEDLDHIRDRHFPGGSDVVIDPVTGLLPGLFDPSVDIVELLNEAQPTEPIEVEQGKFERVVDVGRVIGTTGSGAPSTTICVETGAGGGLQTAFPC